MRYFIVDAFADHVFQGNQAGICLVEQPMEEMVMQNIAAENNLAETAFISRNGKDFNLRWFTPEVEMDLCGHATLASAYVLSTFVDTSLEAMKFHTLSGVLTVTKRGELFEMDFPARKPIETTVDIRMMEALNAPVLEAHRSRDMLLLVESEDCIRSLQPNLALLSQIPDCFAVIVTAKGDEVDFVSRFFAPNAGIPEDPVTGSSHSTLIPFWAERLQKSGMVAKQLSKRGGTLYCEDCGERVKISGHAVSYLSGEIHI
ncbi:MAG: PhzF family phenazine biosynthesis protein [Oscillospiraceae bacterium]|nr:PhzF family phenazine biosynthesis protein [Oscillospiraceae bacterium]